MIERINPSQKRELAHKEFCKLKQKMKDVFFINSIKNPTDALKEFCKIGKNWSVYPEINLRRICKFKNKYLND